MAAWRSVLFFLIGSLWIATGLAACPDQCVCLPNSDPETAEESYTVSCLDLKAIPAWPADIQPITDLFLVQLDVDSIGIGDFAGISSLRSLTIRFSKIGFLDWRAFNNLHGVSSSAVIMLAYNTIGSIANQAFYKLSGFASVQFIGGSIGTVQSGAFTEVQCGSFVVSGVEISSIESRAFGSSVTFTKGFGLPSALNALPDPVKNKVPDLFSIGFTGCEDRAIVNAQSSFLSIVANTIGSIATEAFAGVTMPSLMNIHDNDIGLIEAGVFGEGNAEAVTVSHNRIEGLAAKAFAPLKDTNKFFNFNNQVECAATSAMSGVESDEITEEGNDVTLGSPDSNSTYCQAALAEGGEGGGETPRLALSPLVMVLVPLFLAKMGLL
ncbi:hypothetical protein CAPTEDRAFT_207173 [Capitella teleta]|uniref:Receptor L-domain domain-containing protein n=1 Tax=Capitella teleta TaxID=283909 RepID=R7T6T8_CAPTE|nr:hypothetical protein CAPTEDRAFT_207173 [Capitella teleta]|eukprot:ELT89299.1 hypothetical protein CAPTEDRAFT_207173 [Capitella teleta]